MFAGRRPEHGAVTSIVDPPGNTTNNCPNCGAATRRAPLEFLTPGRKEP
jgi:hypothetical protein